MNDLLKFTLEAHGGLANWNKYESISARIFCGGRTFRMKQQSGVLDDLYVTSHTRKEFTTLYPFINEDWHTSFEPHRVAIEDSNNQVIEALNDPRSSFANHVRETPWSRLQLVYFSGYALWTYFNTPFCFTDPGYQTEEIGEWQENGATYRRLRVTFPSHVATHSAVQTFYIDQAGLIKRHDYDVDIIGGATSSHYPADYIDVGGIKIATKRRVYIRQEDNTALIPEPLLVSIDLKEISLQ